MERERERDKKGKGDILKSQDYILQRIKNPINIFNIILSSSEANQKPDRYTRP